MRVNFLTDDPWNPAHRAPWFLDAIQEYDRVFTPRQANVGDLEAAGVPAVSMLPFGYAPDVHYPEAPAPAEAHEWEADVMVAGGADRDRIDILAPLIRAGFRVALYGGYWDRFRETRDVARGPARRAGLRRATGAAKVCLGLVRRANRDGHCMRTYEVPAMGGCLVAEDTADHRALFGADGEAVAYFTHAEDALDKVAALVRRADLRLDLRRRAHAHCHDRGPHVRGPPADDVAGHRLESDDASFGADAPGVSMIASLKIAIVVHGRFHGFDLARALMERGHDVTVFTNYPTWAVARFGIPPAHSRCFPMHGLLSRRRGAAAEATVGDQEARLHKMFGRWAERELRGERWDVIHCWSGVSEELLASTRVESSLTLLMRGSAHIRRAVTAARGGREHGRASPSIGRASG